MSICVEDTITGIQSNSDSIDECVNLVLLDKAEYLQILSNTSLGLPPITSTDVITIASATLLFWATCFVFNYLAHHST